MRWAAILAVIGALVATQALAQDHGAQISTSAGPARWLSGPSDQNLGDFYPPLAFVQSIKGSTAIDCTIHADTTLTCALVSERPAGYGFGDAAIAMSRAWRMQPPEISRMTGTEARVRVPIAFLMDPSDEHLESVDLPLTLPGRRGEGDDFKIRSGISGVTIAYPEEARRANLEGFAEIDCVKRLGVRWDCAVEREEPANEGFGAAAIADIQALYAGGVDPDENVQGTAARFLTYFHLFDSTDAYVPPDLMAPVQPTWESFPSADDAAAASRAVTPGAGGVAMLSCRIREDRGFDCAVAAEEPEEHGFGAAGLSLAPHFRLAQSMMGKPGFHPGDHFGFPMLFAPTGTPTPAPTRP